jgi:DNA excision repair protein ERCC-6-like 2
MQINPAINRWLRDYQREGAQFFYERYKEGRGGILGDDMGLGQYYGLGMGASLSHTKIR